MFYIKRGLVSLALASAVLTLPISAHADSGQQVSGQEASVTEGDDGPLVDATIMATAKGYICDYCQYNSVTPFVVGR